MLIYARIILVILLLSAIIQILGGVYVSTQLGFLVSGGISIVFGLVFAWLAWDNWSEASRCAKELE